MHHSSWDLEVHAREMQERRLREVKRARQLDEALAGNGYGRGAAPNSTIARVIGAVRTWFSPARTSAPDPVGSAAASAHFETGLPAISADEPRYLPAAPSNRISNAYAGMAVLARGTAARTAEQPCAVGDC